MGKLMLGKDIDTMSKEEIAEVMAKMRAMRNGNGRKGIKNKNVRNLETNDFPLENPDPKLHGKYKNEHIKAIFVTTKEVYRFSKAKIPIFIFGFLTDSNKYAFEEFRDYARSQSKNNVDHNAYRIRRFNQMFGKKNIDKETYVVVDATNIPKESFVYTQLAVMAKYNEAKLKWVTNHEMVRKFIKEYRIYKNRTVFNNCHTYGKKQMDKIFAEIYVFIVENSLCPWINKESLDEINSLFKYKRHSYTIAELGLFYAVLRKFDALLCKRQGRFGKWLRK